MDCQVCHFLFQATFNIWGCFSRILVGHRSGHGLFSTLPCVAFCSWRLTHAPSKGTLCTSTMCCFKETTRLDWGFCSCCLDGGAFAVPQQSCLALWQGSDCPKWFLCSCSRAIFACAASILKVRWQSSCILGYSADGILMGIGRKYFLKIESKV